MHEIETREWRCPICLSLFNSDEPLCPYCGGLGEEPDDDGALFVEDSK